MKTVVVGVVVGVVVEIPMGNTLFFPLVWIDGSKALSGSRNALYRRLAVADGRVAL